MIDLKKERNAVILAHNYMEPALFHSGIADYTRHSLGLSPDAARTTGDHGHRPVDRERADVVERLS